MVSTTFKLFAIGLFLTSLSAFSLSYKDTNEQWVSADGFERDIGSLDTLIMGAYNVENLFHEAVVAPEIDAFVSFPFADAENPIKPMQKIKDVSRAILDIRYDILVVEEVENLYTLELLNKHYLNNLYQPFLIEGNDPRGIDVGFFVKKNLPLFIETRTNKNETWQDPTQEGETDVLFSRDLPELHVRAGKETNPWFVLMGTHYKSKISRKGDPESRILRKAQVDRTAEIFKRLEEKFNGQTALFIAGDFNGEVSHEKEFTAFQKKVQLLDAFDCVSPAVPKKDRFTHLYFPKGKPMEKSQLDGFMFDYHAKSAIRRAYPHRYTDLKGNLLPIPQSYQEKDRISPSDHFPVVVEVDTKAFSN